MDLGHQARKRISHRERHLGADQSSVLMEVIGSSCKFKLKKDQSGTVTKYKARLVARVDMQEMDWNSVFAPSLRYTSLRVILALASYHDYEIEQMDVVIVFLDADVVFTIYMEQPQGFKRTSKDGEELVW